MSFIKELNEQEAILLGEILDKYIEVSTFVVDNYLSDIHEEFLEIYTLLSRPDRDDAIFEFVRYRMHNAVKELRAVPMITSDADRKVNSFINRGFAIYQDKVKDLVHSKSEMCILKKRIGLTVKRINNIKQDIYSDMMRDIVVVFKEILVLLKETGHKEVFVNELKNLDKEEEVDEGFQHLKIFSYKEMCRHAQDNGYILDRQSGDHMIFKHEKSCRIVVIPAHDLTRSLSIAIQKQIYTRKVS